MDDFEAARRSRKWTLAKVSMAAHVAWLVVMLMQMIRGQAPDSVIWLAAAGGIVGTLGAYGASNVGAARAAGGKA
jgi:hypothetical protein